MALNMAIYEPKLKKYFKIDDSAQFFLCSFMVQIIADGIRYTSELGSATLD